MPPTELSNKVQDSLGELPDDPVLLAAVMREIEVAADDPARECEPAKYPYAADRLMRSFAVRDSDGFTWNTTMTLQVEPHRIFIRTLLIACIDYDGEIEHDTT